MPAVNTRKKTKRSKSSAKSKATRKKAGIKSGAQLPAWQVLTHRVGVAGAVALGVVLVIGFAVLWISGVPGRIAEDTGRFASNKFADAMIASGFDVRDISVIGRRKTSLHALKSALGPVDGVSMLHFNPDQARARVEEIGWVRSAAVSRLWPNRINISIRERVPAALWQTSGALRLVDQEGAIIREIGAYEYTDLPLIVGAGAPEAAAGILGVLDELGMFDTYITALVRVSGRRWNLRIGNAMDIKLPETGYKEAVRDLAVLQEAAGVLDRNLEYIDFRDPERVVFRCRGPNDSKLSDISALSGGFSCPSPDISG